MRIVLFIFVLLFSTPGFSQSPGETSRQFGDWLATCQPNGYCAATTSDNPNPGNDSVADYILRVARHERGIYWEVSMTAIAHMPADFQKIEFDIDGQINTFEQFRDYGAYGNLNDFYFISEPGEKLLNQLVAGNRAVTGFLDEDLQKQTAGFSLSGLTAALLWIDERQNRIGSERLAYAAPIGLTPLSRDFPTAVPSDLIIQHARDTECESFEDFAGAYQVITQQVDEEHWIYLIPCTAGAYNYFYKVYQGNGTYYAPVYFAEFDDLTGWTGTAMVVNPIYDRETKILTSFSKGRGIGDCGATGKWQWQNYTFIMLEYRAKFDCDGQGGPESFPLIFKLDPPKMK